MRNALRNISVILRDCLSDANSFRVLQDKVCIKFMWQRVISDNVNDVVKNIICISMFKKAFTKILILANIIITIIEPRRTLHNQIFPLFREDK